MTDSVLTMDKGRCLSLRPASFANLLEHGIDPDVLYSLFRQEENFQFSALTHRYKRDLAKKMIPGVRA
jgi:hypothetical protein